MNFELSEEQQLVVDQVAKFVRNDSPVERFRTLRESDSDFLMFRNERTSKIGLVYARPDGNFGFVEEAE